MESPQQRLRGRVAESVRGKTALSDVGRAFSVALTRDVPHDGWVLFEFDPVSHVRVDAAGSGAISTVSDRAFVHNELRGRDQIRFIDLARQAVPAGILAAASPLPSQRLHEFMRPAGFGSELRVCMRRHGVLWGALALLRRDDVRGFNDRDARLVLSAATPLLTPLRAITERAWSDAAPRPPGVIVLDRRGEIACVSDTAEAWFDAMLGPARRRCDVPRVIYEIGLRTDDQGVLAIRQLRAGGWAALSASRLDPDQTAVCVRTPTITELLPALAARRGYGPREQQVLHLLVEGRAGKRIARELDITLRTVDYHLRQIYRKAGVASREELFAQLAT